MERRPKGTGCIFKPPNSRFWHIKWSSPHGPRTKSAKTEDWDEAQKRLNEELGKVAQGNVSPIDYGKVKLKDLTDALLQDYHLNKRRDTAKVEIRVNRILEFFGEKQKAMNVTTDRIKEFILRLREEGALDGTIRNHLANLKRAFSLALECTPPKVPGVPFVPMPPKPPSRKGFFELEQYEAVRKELPDYLKGLLTFAYITGWRQGRCLSLKWEQVDFKAGFVHPKPGPKNKQVGKWPLNLLGLEECLKEQLRNRVLGCPYVFHRRGRRIRDFRKAWKSATKRAKCGHRHFHDLRRTTVRNLVRAGVSDNVAMKLSGHKTRSVFDNYDITADQDLLEAGNRMNDFYGKAAVSGA